MAVADARFRASADPLRLDVVGWLHYWKEEFSTALPFLERAVGLDPDEPEFRYHLGMALYRSGAKERALEELARALPDDADYPGVAQARATHTELLKDLERDRGGPPSGDRS